MPAEFVVPWRARYYEVDQQGVVFNGWYLSWFDEAISRFLEAGGLDTAGMAAAAFDLQLVRSEIDWRAGVRWEEPVEIVVRPGRIGTTSFDVHFTVRRNGEETCAAKTVYVAIAPDGSGKTPVPPALRALLTGE
ncbi:acyl-CoA thioesterase [Cryptosporangium phraense]|uniref:Acyl-CoA thioesterase n=1 Tax=Cryptosporangium phraense TaxID=2593070 RepID=A0A545ARN9_9ACTN|nr:thioesterase family protein [Cryptosporangium phraense]TQS43998.1 acyl-CoA thioesterase [Cryptosporangium phraense]